MKTVRILSFPRVARWQQPIVRVGTLGEGVYLLRGPSLDQQVQTVYHLSREGFADVYDAQVALNAGAITWESVEVMP